MNLTSNYNGGQVEPDMKHKYGSLYLLHNVQLTDSNLGFSPRAFKGLVDISGPFLFTIHARTKIGGINGRLHSSST